jgi:autophagy-related protein 17
MASPGSPASLADSASSVESDHSLTLEDLVQLFVAAKRALSNQTVLWRANDIVESARNYLEENALLLGRIAAARSLIKKQIEMFGGISAGAIKEEEAVHTEFQVAASFITCARC